LAFFKSTSCWPTVAGWTTDFVPPPNWTPPNAAGEKRHRCKRNEKWNDGSFHWMFFRLTASLVDFSHLASCAPPAWASDLTFFLRRRLCKSIFSWMRRRRFGSTFFQLICRHMVSSVEKRMTLVSAYWIFNH
jgi:hypothetical protein